MFQLLWFQIQLPEALAFLLNPISEFIINLAAWILIAILVNFILMRIIRFITRQLPGDL